MSQQIDPGGLSQPKTAHAKTAPPQATTARTAMILAAGRGSRLAPLTDDVPKPLLDIQGKPLIVHQLHWLRRAGVKRVVINLFHLGTDIERELGDGRAFDLEIVYSPEPELLETGGGIQHARQLLGNQPFLLLNGDIWTDFDFAGMPLTLAPHLQAHLWVTPTPANRDEGDFQLAHRRLQRPATTSARNWVYCGIALMRPSIVGNRSGAFSLREPLFEAAAAGSLGGSPWLGDWTDIGTLDQLIALRKKTGAAKPAT